MDNLNINAYIGKSAGDPVTHTLWNNVFGAIQTKMNEIITALNNGGSGDSTPSSSLAAAVLYINGTPWYSAPNNKNDIELNVTGGESYEIEGTLYGSIKLIAEAQPSDNLHIRLCGATIVNPAVGDEDESFAIKYETPEENQGFKDLIVTLEKDTVNHLVCMTEREANGELEDGQEGALWSMNNLVIQGVGYLSVINKGGHGVRASELKFAGPHIYAETAHDAFHAKKISVYDGVFHIAKAKDGFGTGANGNILWFKGDITYGNIEEDVFDSGQTGYYVGEGVTGIGSPLDILNINNGPIHNMSGIENYAQTLTPSVKGYASKEDCQNDTNGTELYTNGTQIVFTTYRFVRLTGNVGPLEFADTLDDDVTVYLNNAFVTAGLNEYPAIYYQKESGRLKIIAERDTVNYVIGCINGSVQDPSIANLDAIKSEKNIEINVKNNAVLYVSCAYDGIDGDDVKITDSKGALIVTNCGWRGIKGSGVVIGPEADIKKSGITPITDPSNQEYKTVEGYIIVKDNCTTEDPASEVTGTVDTETQITAGGFADIYCRQGKKVTKGRFLTTDAELKGVLIVGSIGAVIGIDMGYAHNFYYNDFVSNEAFCIEKQCSPTRENCEVVPYGKAPFMDKVAVNIEQEEQAPI